MGKVKVGYIISESLIGYDWYNIIGFKPEKVILSDVVKGAGKFCPALKKSVHNLYMIKSPFDIHLKHTFVDNDRSYIIVQDDSSFKPETFNNMFVVSDFEFRNNKKRPIIQFNLPLIFVSDDDIRVEIGPPIGSYQNLPGIIPQGTFSIKNWHRIINWMFEWFDTDKEIIIKRGDPLLYIKFLPKNRDDEVVLEKLKSKEAIDVIEKSRSSITNLKITGNDIITENLMENNRSINPIIKDYSFFKSHLRIMREKLHIM